jgi:hypothetical protein
MGSSCSPPISSSIVSTEAAFIMPSVIDVPRTPGTVSKRGMLIVRPPTRYEGINFLYSNPAIPIAPASAFKETDRCIIPTPNYEKLLVPKSS